MGLRCSLLGHEYAEPDTKRDREERGDEVVETVRSVETCRHCGTERIVSENTEVRSVEPASAAADATSDATTGGVDADDGIAPVTGPVADAGVETGDGPDGASETEFDLDATSAEEDDGVILEDEAERDDRAPGEWPESEDTRDDERTADEERAGGADTAEGDADEATEEDAEGADDDGDIIEATEEDAVADEASADEAVDGEQTDGDSEIIEATEDDVGDAESSPWPEHDAEDEGFAAEAATEGGSEVSFGGLAPEDDGRSETSTGIASAGPLDATERTASTSVKRELVCPECGGRNRANGSSLRAGDICPECHRGYLAEEDLA